MKTPRGIEAKLSAAGYPTHEQGRGDMEGDACNEANEDLTGKF